MRTVEVIEITELIGHTITKIEGLHKCSESLIFHRDDGRMFEFWYEGDCCATCKIDDITGDIKGLIGIPLLIAESVTHSEMGCVSQTWTFYVFTTKKGTVTVRWHGASNEYYSESVSFREVEEMLEEK